MHSKTPVNPITILLKWDSFRNFFVKNRVPQLLTCCLAANIVINTGMLNFRDGLFTQQSQLPEQVIFGDINIPVNLDAVFSFVAGNLEAIKEETDAARVMAFKASFRPELGTYIVTALGETTKSGVPNTSRFWFERKVDDAYRDILNNLTYSNGLIKISVSDIKDGDDLYLFHSLSNISLFVFHRIDIQESGDLYFIVSEYKHQLTQEEAENLEIISEEVVANLRSVKEKFFLVNPS